MILVWWKQMVKSIVKKMYNWIENIYVCILLKINYLFIQVWLQRKTIEKKVA